MYTRTTANRSGKITVEIHDNFTASGYIDGECVVSRYSIFQKLSSRQIVKGKWSVEETSETYVKRFKGGYKRLQVKLDVKANPLKEFTKAYAVTPSQFCKVFNAAVWKSAISPYKEFQSLYFGKRGVNMFAFFDVVGRYDLLKQALKDNQKNILPILSKYGKTPQELKEEFGKGLWKKLCANSFHRNRLLVNSALGVECNIGWDSGALKGNRPAARHWAKNVCKIPYVKMKGELPIEVHLFLDTERMANALRLPFNEKWSKLKMQEKHNEYAAIINRQTEELRIKRDEAYQLKIEKLQSIDLSKVYPQTEFELDGVKATILTTYEQIQQEGVAMHHCVGSYAEEAMDGTYVVVHISGESEESTLGLSLSNKWVSESHLGQEEGIISLHSVRNFTLNQHYGKCNSQVKSENHKAVAKVVIEYLNNLKLTKESYEGL